MSRKLLCCSFGSSSLRIEHPIGWSRRRFQAAAQEGECPLPCRDGGLFVIAIGPGISESVVGGIEVDLRGLPRRLQLGPEPIDTIHGYRGIEFAEMPEQGTIQVAEVEDLFLGGAGDAVLQSVVDHGTV